MSYYKKGKSLRYKEYLSIIKYLKYRSAGYGFLFRSEFFFPEFNIRLYDKNYESDFFFPSTKIRIFFQQHWETEYFFLEKKNHNPSPPSS